MLVPTDLFRVRVCLPAFAPEQHRQSLQIQATRSPLYDVASDGSRSLLLERDSSISEGDVELLLNWPSLLSNQPT
jgi:hypothetical protein